MHVPDGFFDAPTSLGTAAASAGVVAIGLRRAAHDLSDRMTPMAGLVSAFIFALQMLNFPVVSGTSGHLLGGALAAVLVGPWIGLTCVSIVVFVQALLFADGGLSALGLNVLLIAIVPAAVAYGIFSVAVRLLPPTRRSLVAAAAAGAFVSVPVTAAVFSVLFAVGGAVDLRFGAVLGAMVGTHLLIGIGEAIITGAVVSAVVASRPDLVNGARHLVTELESRPTVGVAA